MTEWKRRMGPEEEEDDTAQYVVFLRLTKGLFNRCPKYMISPGPKVEELTTKISHNSALCLTLSVHCIGNDQSRERVFVANSATVSAGRTELGKSIQALTHSQVHPPAAQPTASPQSKQSRLDSTSVRQPNHGPVPPASQVLPHPQLRPRFRQL